MGTVGPVHSPSRHLVCPPCTPVCAITVAGRPLSYSMVTTALCWSLPSPWVCKEPCDMMASPVTGSCCVALTLRKGDHAWWA